MSEIKGLICSILREGKLARSDGNKATSHFDKIADYSNGGISGKVDDVTLIGIIDLDGNFSPLKSGGVFKPSEKAPPVVLERRLLASREFYSAFPCNEKGEKLPGWYMFGGAFIYASDSRFPDHAPVMLMDRKEN